MKIKAIMELVIKKIEEENFTIVAENEDAMIYAKALIKRGDYIFKMSIGNSIIGDGYKITRERKENMFIENVPNAL